jgi:hypothetical protein
MTAHNAIRCCGRLWIGLFFATLSMLSAANEDPKRVLILNPFGRDVEPFSAAVSEFRATLVRELGEPVDFHLSGVTSARGDDRR